MNKNLDPISNKVEFVIVPLGKETFLNYCIPEVNFLTPKEKFNFIFRQRGYRTLAMLGISADYFGTYNLEYFKEKTRLFSLVETEIQSRQDLLHRYRKKALELLLPEEIRKNFPKGTKLLYHKNLGSDIILKVVYAPTTGTSEVGCLYHGHQFNQVPKR